MEPTIIEERGRVRPPVLENGGFEENRPCGLKLPVTRAARLQQVLEYRQQRDYGNLPRREKRGRNLHRNAVGTTDVYRAVLGEDAFDGVVPQTVGALKIGELTRISGLEVLIILVEDPCQGREKHYDGTGLPTTSVVHKHPGVDTPLDIGSVVYFIVRRTYRTVTDHHEVQGDVLLEFIFERLMRSAEAAEDPVLPPIDAGFSTCRKVYLEYEYVEWPTIRHANGTPLLTAMHLGPLDDIEEGEYAMNCRADFNINCMGFVRPEIVEREMLYAQIALAQGEQDQPVELIDDDVDWVPGRYCAVQPGSWAIFAMRPLGEFDEEGYPENSESLLDGVREEMKRFERTPAETFLRTAHN